MHQKKQEVCDRDNVKPLVKEIFDNTYEITRYL